MIGVLALQGDFEAHAALLTKVGASSREVRHPEQLRELTGLVLPGGESSALLNLMRDEPWFEELRRFHAGGGSLLATCAGAILLAARVEPTQPSLGLLDVTIRRNGYGRQIDSFEASVGFPGGGGDLDVVFIRAPRITAVGDGVDVLSRYDGEPVLVRQGRILAATFHPEITGDDRLHRRFVEQAEQAQALSA